MEQTLTPSLNPDLELTYIRKIMAESRRNMAEDGWPYIVWGIIVAVAMTNTYISALLNVDLYTGWVWIGLVALGYVYIFYMVRTQKHKEPRVKSFIDRLQGAIWFACGSTLGLMILLIMLRGVLTNNAPDINPFYTCSITSAILGIAYFLSGFTLDIKWLRNIGFAWWAGSIVMFLWPSIHVLGMYALWIVLFQIVPGILLNRRYRSELSSEQSFSAAQGA